MVHVVGLPGAGKSTLTARLGALLGWPVFSIGRFRRGRSPDWQGEADAWEAFYDAIVQAGGSEVILETSGLNGRLHRLERYVTAEGELVRVKLTCPRGLLHGRVQERDADRDSSPWAYSGSIPNRHVFIDRFHDVFEELPADIEVDTSEHGPDEVLAIVRRELGV